MGRSIAILTDFGHTDNYVGIMKGVIRKISPFADIIDLNHGIESGNIRSAAYNLESAYQYFPKNTIFLCVVDPGVGSTRKAVAIESEGFFFVAPDNGLLTPIIQKSKSNITAVELTNKKFQLDNRSSTFHGRDIFAPVAAHISMKTELLELGDVINIKNLVQLNDYIAKKNGNEITGNIVHKDKFGNLITDIPEDWVNKKKRSKDLSCRI
ncbi:MAG: SAM-dependent chlorinase/fluorinase [Candidatus Kapabacteria bacterium]|nr:SAM-dependent chlorinase/fluorinase [Ignavibacteriota bacterium]MCW5885525.1 SAM-dependent chlorinase/fluorinase [Candidatus Kapabacteria bacterium]